MGWYTKEELRAMGKWDDDPQPLKAFTDVEAKRYAKQLLKDLDECDDVDTCKVWQLAAWAVSK